MRCDVAGRVKEVGGGAGAQKKMYPWYCIVSNRKQRMYDRNTVIGQTFLICAYGRYTPRYNSSSGLLRLAFYRFCTQFNPPEARMLGSDARRRAITT